MSLSHYRKKRKFDSTPEPEGGIAKHTGPLSFVIQKHAASRLHYDFRLEVDGVLKSWAVPKGPSLNPDDKRLAMMVEDHPLDYASFEGIIPKDNYGAGTVMVWDTGVYSPIAAVDRKNAEKIILEQIEKGHLTFVMLGKKLSGEFALVRSKKAGENAWLLIKARDEYASKKDILVQDRSVLTERSMDEIARQAEKKNEVWFSKPKHVDLSHAPKIPMPTNIKPMLAATAEEPFDNKDWIFEMKWDGYRAIAEISSGNVRLYSRNHHPFNEKFAPLAESLKRFPGDAIFDGEVVVVDETGKPQFQDLQDYPKIKNGNLIYYVFDLLYYDGYSLENLPLVKRKEILEKILPPLPNIVYSDHIQETGIAFFRQASKLHLEGIMAKKANSIYKENSRSDDWLKIKSQKAIDVIIGGFTNPKGSRNHFGALVVGIEKNGKLEYVGHVGGGFDDAALSTIVAQLKDLEQESCPFAETPVTNGPVRWVKPHLKCTVTFSNWTKDHIMRHPIFVEMINEDSDTGNSVQEPNSNVVLNFTNLSKVYWPDDTYTKRDLIEYYEKISPYILPYLKDRPESLLRHPNGITGESFFHKDMRQVPEYITTVPLYSESGEKDIHWIICNDKETLLYMANLGCIEINPWSSRYQTKDFPDYLTIDLDPNGAPFEEVITTALHVKKIMDNAEIDAFIKTSGKSGMHIFVPLGAKYTFEHTRQFAEILARVVAIQLPDTTSVIRDPKKREKKIYLDFLQNRQGQTLTAPYSVRPVPHAQVSTPVDWDEVTTKLHPSQFTIKTIFKRIEKKGDLWKDFLHHKGFDMLKSLTLLEKI